MNAAENITVLRDAAPLIEVGEGERKRLYLTGSLNEDIVLNVAAGGCIKVVFTAIDGDCSQLSLRAELNGAGAELEIYGVFVAADGEHRTVRVEVRHNVPDCRSREIVKGVAAGGGYGVFEGLVYVAPDAQRTEALQTSNNLLLGDRSRIETHPQLEIYADDVRCSHGATVGQMDDEAVYYMRQRGIDEAEARRLQMGGFLRDVLSHIDDEDVAAEFTAAVDRKIERLQ